MTFPDFCSRRPCYWNQNHAACTETDAVLAHAHGVIVTKEHDVEESMQKTKDRVHWQQIGTLRPKRNQSF